MGIIYVPRAFGGTLLITIAQEAPPPTIMLTATGRNGSTTAIGRDGKSTAIGRDGKNTGTGRG